MTGVARWLPAVLLAVTANAEPQRAGEWLAWVRVEAARERAAWSADPSLAALARGAAACCDPQYDPATKGLRTRRPAGDAADIAAFEAFLAERGDRLAVQLASGAPVEGGDAFRPLVQARALWRADKELKSKRQRGEALAAGEVALLAYAERVVADGQALLARAYAGEPLTRGDLDALRAYAVQVDIRGTGGKGLPSALGLRAKTQPAVGDPAPELALPTVGSVWSHPAFAAKEPFDALRVLTWEGVAEYLLAIPGYERKADGGIAATSFASSELPVGADASGWVRMSDHRGKRPVLLILGDATDTYCCHGYCVPKLEDLHRVFGDRVAFYFVQTTVHDTRMPFRDYFAARPEAVNRRAMHVLSMEERATTARSFYMAYPATSIPCLLDRITQPARDAFHDFGGEAEFWLIDVDGVVAYRTKGPNLCSGWGPWGRLHAGQLIRIDCLTRQLLALLRNQGRRDPTLAASCEHLRIDDPAWDAVTVPSGTTLWLAGTLRSVDVAAQRVTLERDAMPRANYPGLRWWDAAPRANAVAGLAEGLALLEAWTREDTPREMTLAIAAGTYLAIDGVRCPLADFRAGDRVGLQVPAQSMTQPMPAFVLRAFRLPPRVAEVGRRPPTR